MQSTLDNEVKSDMIWRPPTRLPPTLLIHPLLMYWPELSSCSQLAQPRRTGGSSGSDATALCRSTGVLLPRGAFPGQLSWHKTWLHLICGPATRLHRHTKKLGQLGKLPRAHCQVCDHCVTGAAAESARCWQTCPALPGRQPSGRRQGGRLRRAN